MALFTDDELRHFRRRHVKRALFGRLDFPDQVHRLHSGSGKFTVDGQTFRGVGNPLPGATQMVSLAAIEDPRFGAAPKVTVTLAGVNREFLQSTHATRAEIEGRPAELFIVVVDQETMQPLTGLKPLFRGQLTSPVIRFAGRGMRAVEISIESRWAKLMRPFGGTWSYADVFRRGGGDTGGRYIGTKTQEQFF